MSEEKEITDMDPSLYKAALEGEIGAFKVYTSFLHLLLTPNKNTLLHIHIPAQPRPEKKSTRFVEEILSACPSLLWQANANDEIPLHLAARYGSSDIVQLLIERAKTIDEADPENGDVRQMLRMTTKEKDTALHEAVRLFDHIEVVKLLTKEDPDLSNSVNVIGKTPLYLATERGFRKSVIEMLLTCKSPAYAGPNGRNILHAAVMGRRWDSAGLHTYLEFLSKILEVKGASLTKEADQKGWTPLHYVALSGYSSMAKVLLRNDTSAAYVADRDDKTALHIAALHDNQSVIKSIISSCPNCCELVDKRGWNFLHFAMEGGNIGTINAVLEYHKFLSCLLNEKDNEGNTPLHLLAHHPGLAFDNYSSASDYIKRSKVDKMALNKKNQSPLDIITDNATSDEKWKKHITKELLVAGAVSDYITHRDVCNEGTKDEDYLSEIKKATETHIVVAALIATVAFAASFTMPGGYISDKGPDQGTPVLARRTAFKAFVISNSIAMMLSSSAVFIYIFLAMPLPADKYKFPSYFKLAAYLNVFAAGAMMVAFMTGQYAVLQHSSGLAIATCVIGSSFFFFYYELFLRSYVAPIVKPGSETSFLDLLDKVLDPFNDLLKKALVEAFNEFKNLNNKLDRLLDKAPDSFQAPIVVATIPFLVLLFTLVFATVCFWYPFQVLIRKIKTPWLRNANPSKKNSSSEMAIQ